MKGGAPPARVARVARAARAAHDHDDHNEHDDHDDSHNHDHVDDDDHDDDDHDDEDDGDDDDDNGRYDDDNDDGDDDDDDDDHDHDDDDDGADADDAQRPIDGKVRQGKVFMVCTKRPVPEVAWCPTYGFRVRSKVAACVLTIGWNLFGPLPMAQSRQGKGSGSIVEGRWTDRRQVASIRV